MERFIHEQTLANYRLLIAESELDPGRNEVQHGWLLKLLAAEVANGVALLGAWLESRSLATRSATRLRVRITRPWDTAIFWRAS